MQAMAMGLGYKASPQQYSKLETAGSGYSKTSTSANTLSEIERGIRQGLSVTKNITRPAITDGMGMSQLIEQSIGTAGATYSRTMALYEKSRGDFYDQASVEAEMIISASQVTSYQKMTGYKQIIDHALKPLDKGN